MTIQQFIASLPALTLSYVSIPTRPDNEQWDTSNKGTKDKAFHYLVTLIMNGRSFQTYDTKGAAHIGALVNNKWVMLFQLPKQVQQAYKCKDTGITGRYCGYSIKPIPPLLDELLDSLRSDVECGSENWPDFAASFGYNVDSIRDKSIYESCVKTRQELMQFFGSEYSKFVSCDPE